MRLSGKDDDDGERQTHIHCPKIFIKKHWTLSTWAWVISNFSSHLSFLHYFFLFYGVVINSQLIPLIKHSRKKVPKHENEINISFVRSLKKKVYWWNTTMNVKFNREGGDDKFEISFKSFRREFFRGEWEEEDEENRRQKNVPSSMSETHTRA